MRRGSAGPAAGEGTRFRVFAQPPFSVPDPTPDTIEVSSPPGTIGPGPADNRMYFVRPLGKRFPYGVNVGAFGTSWFFMPPWIGPYAPPVVPGSDGHFDHLAVGTPEFEAAHLFGTARFVMDVWEGYLGHPIRWHFGRDFDRLELSVLPRWDNAQMGYGYLETGSARRRDGKILPFALNFDVIAHELGHAIIYSEVGLPSPHKESGEYFGFHEAAADWVALIAGLHIPSVVTSLLGSCHGNLYTFNEFNRFSEFSDNEEIRVASNFLKLSDFSLGWSDEHELSQPLSGALFDIFVDLFHETLVAIGVISRTLEELSDITENKPQYVPELQAEFDRAYALDRDGFVFAIEQTRGLVGDMLAAAWKRLPPDDLSYANFADAMIDAGVAISGDWTRDILLANFWWRDIGIVRAGPRLRPPGPRSHAFSGRSALPEDESVSTRMSYRERHLLCGRCSHQIWR